MPNIELLQEKAVRVVNFKSPVAHTEPILKGMNQLKLPDMYTCHLLKLYYKLYRNKLPAYLENMLPEYGDSQHNLRNSCIRLPAIRCEFGKLNANTKCTSGYESWLIHLIHHCILTFHIFLSSCLRTCPFNYLLPSEIIYSNYLKVLLYCTDMHY